jgi:hypothetical protein
MGMPLVAALWMSYWGNYNIGWDLPLTEYAMPGCLFVRRLWRRSGKTEQMLWSIDSILNAMQCNGTGCGKADVMTLRCKEYVEGRVT